MSSGDPERRLCAHALHSEEYEPLLSSRVASTEKSDAFFIHIQGITDEPHCKCRIISR